MKRQQVIDFVKHAGINYHLIEHKAVFTVADLDKAISEKVPTKCLLLEEQKGDRKYMVVMRGNVRLDLKKLAGEINSSRLQFIRPDSVEKFVGVKPGAVSIFGLLHPGSKVLSIIVDNKLLDKKEIGFHPNDNTATIFISPNDLLKVLKNIATDYRIVSL